MNIQSFDWRKLFCFLPLFLLSEQSVAFGYIPNKEDWMKWPDYCKARYVMTNISKSTGKYQDQVPKHMVKVWEKKVGERTFLHLHHYCLGLTRLEKARMETDPKKRIKLYDGARYQIDNTLSKIYKSAPMYITLSLNYAEACDGAGKDMEALKTIRGLVNSHPKSVQTYLGVSQFFRRKKQYDAAVKSLLLGTERVRKIYRPQLYYKIGFIYLKMKDYENARKYAELAYESGYKDPSLKKLLKDSGHPTMQ